MTEPPVTEQALLALLDALAAAEARAAELEAERTSLHRELAGLLGPITPRAGVTANDQWISKVAVICARAEKAEQALREIALDSNDYADERHSWRWRQQIASATLAAAVQPPEEQRQ